MGKHVLLQPCSHGSPLFKEQILFGPMYRDINGSLQWKSDLFKAWCCIVKMNNVSYQGQFRVGSYTELMREMFRVGPVWSGSLDLSVESCSATGNLYKNVVSGESRKHKNVTV